MATLKITITKNQNKNKTKKLKQKNNHILKDLFSCGCLVYMCIKIYEIANVDQHDDYLCKWILYLVEEVKKDGLEKGIHYTDDGFSDMTITITYYL